ncbi:MAG: M23 family metallopeptidase [Bacteroidales bacterium]|jgi:murein DD-endopeptidase MepM/ murein hydrolase activator NlpD|nr:M23 family metallopeptidase [Bacteroidales bacterium]
MEKQKNKKRLKKLRYKYRLVLMNEDNFEQKISFRLSQLNVIGAVSAFSILWILIMIYLLAFTSLREYIPGYTDPNLSEQFYKMEVTIDSLENSYNLQNQYMLNIQRILRGEDFEENENLGQQEIYDYSGIENTISFEDSILRSEMESLTEYNLYFYDAQSTDFERNIAVVGPMVFFKPINGIITNHFNSAIKHYAIDLVSERNDAVKCVYDGIVILSDWTINTGYVIAIQHPNNFISVYKHNSALLKQQGDIVKAGDPISIIGDTGEQSSGPHLHFELWANGSPVNPLDYISF